jgi:hypothetical protein
MNFLEIIRLIEDKETSFLVLMEFFGGTITFTEIINAFVVKFTNSEDAQDQMKVEKLREYQNSMQRILEHFNFGDATVDNCFPKDFGGFRNYDQFHVELKCKQMGHICYYISVPQGNPYYGMHYNDLGINATFSGYGENGMWKFGWDYLTLQYLSIPNIINSYVEINDLKIMTVETIENDIQNALSVLALNPQQNRQH